MDPVHGSGPYFDGPGPWTGSTEGVHEPGVHVLYFPMLFNEAIDLEFFKVNSLLVIYKYCIVYVCIVQYFFVIVVLSRDQSIHNCFPGGYYIILVL